MEIKKAIKKMAIALVAVLFITVAAPVMNVAVHNQLQMPLYAVTAMAAEQKKEVQQVEEKDVKENDVSVENVDPSAAQKLEKALYTQTETVIFFGGIIAILGIILAITIIVGLSKRKRK